MGLAIERSEGDVLVEGLVKHYAELCYRYNVVPKWMLEYAVCPVHWARLCQENVMRTYWMESSERVWANGRKVCLLEYTLYLVEDAVSLPPMCLFHSLGV